jgi:hypothetical protein
MTGRSDSDKIVPDRGNAGRLLFGAALIFAVAATLTLVFATDAQWLKLAVIAALWAAFLGAMLSVKYRHLAAARAGEVADLQAVYELELEREVAARREYELEVEADTRRRIAEETEDSSRADIAALRAELHALRENLDRLTGGEVLVERIALRAQSTRMRSIGDPLAASAIAADPDIRRSITAGPAATPGRAPGQAPGRVIGAVLEPSTQLLDPVPMPRPQRPDQSRRVGPQRPDGQRREGQRPEGQRSGGSRVDGPRAYRPDGQPADGARPRRDEPTGEQRRSEPVRVPKQSTGEQSRSNLRRDPINPPLPRQPANPTMSRPTGDTGAQPIISRAGGHSGAQPIVGLPAADADSVPTRFAAPVARPATNPGAGDEGGRRRAAEPFDWTAASDGRTGEDYASQQTDTGHAEQTPTRHGNAGHGKTDYVEAGHDEGSFRRGGRHSSGSYAPVPRPVAASATPPMSEQSMSEPAMSATPAYASAGARSGGRRAEPEPAGAHAAGRSVTELLAAHRSAEEGPRRHRRRAD